jgi:prepilin-type N-terminal cleavage/methylation domain-containing protein
MNKKGFTLIELLVTIFVIGFLLTVAFIAFENARSKVRDAKRVANIDQIRKALDLYFNSQEKYPIATSFIELGTENYDFLCSGVAGGGFKSDISDCGANAVLYIDHVPKAFGVDADCPSGTDAFKYRSSAGNDYELKFCLGRKISDLGPGECTASPRGISCP